MSVGTFPDHLGLALIGYRGTGKSTVGRLLAGGLGRPFVDADAEIEARLGRTIASVFREHGEPVFRDHEEAVLAELTGRRNTVLATGGGVVIRGPNREALRRFGFTVWLRADPAVLAARLESDPAAVAGRPALTPAGTLGEIAAVLAARASFYREVADAEIDTEGRSPAEVADAILAILPDGRSGRP